ncbi:MAG: hypothetical protein WA793_09750, partial [Sphingorhabdus sp.]|uniref:hypothetical protein n=1 Tax=Sphingorhabdus sp. TaxID=1902408 RepID=UPI003CA65D55
MTKNTDSKRSKSVLAIEEVSPTRPDIYIGLVGAVGTDLSGIRNELQAQLAIVGYTVQHIKVSELIREALDVPRETNELARIQSLMAAGDAIRQCSEEG